MHKVLCKDVRIAELACSESCFHIDLTLVINSTNSGRKYAVVYWGVYAGIRRIPTSGFFGQRILTSVIINKQGTFRPFAMPLCVYPPPFLGIHHWKYGRTSYCVA